jgi:hypothetical protein
MYREDQFLSAFRHSWNVVSDYLKLEMSNIEKDIYYAIYVAIQSISIIRHGMNILSTIYMFIINNL